MNNQPFGYRFFTVAVLSFLLASLWIYIFSPGDNPFPNYRQIISGNALYLSLLLILFCWYLAGVKILMSRVRRRIFLSYLVFGLLFIIIIVFAWIDHYSAIKANSVLLASGEIFWLHIWKMVLPLGIALVPPIFVYQVAIARELWLKGEKLGGSSRWAGAGTFSRKQFQANLRQRLFSTPETMDEGVYSDRIFLGRSLFRDDPFSRLVGVKDDAHMMTIGSIGAGKSTTVLYPNLSLYKGSAIVIDPKGELAQMTYRRRNQRHWLATKGITSQTHKSFFNGECHVLDPFGVLKKDGIPSSNYNLLSEIDIENDPMAASLVEAISDGCVEPESKENKYFEEVPKLVIEGLIVHVLTTHPKKDHNLPFIADLWNGIDPGTKEYDEEYFKTTLQAMRMNNAMNGRTQQAAKMLQEMSERERAQVNTALARSFKWLTDQSIRQHVVESDFKFSKIGLRGKIDTVYIVVPFGMMEGQMRWLRTLVSLAIKTMDNERTKTGDKPEIPTLFIMDEFPRLGGRINAITEGFPVLRGNRIKLWPVMQNIGQLQSQYPGDWTTMAATSNVQVFGAGMGDAATAKWVSETLGRTIVTRKKGGEVVNEAERELLPPAQVATMLGKLTNRQIIFPNDGYPMRLERLAYQPMSLEGKRFYEIGLDGLRGHFEEW